MLFSQYVVIVCVCVFLWGALARQSKTLSEEGKAVSAAFSFVPVAIFGLALCAFLIQQIARVLGAALGGSF